MLRPLVSQLRALVETTTASGQIPGPISTPASVQTPQAIPPSWPFRTQAAQKVWNTAQDLIFAYPELGAQDVLQRAIEDSGIDGMDMTPEDNQLVLMAIKWLQDGVPQPAATTPVSVVVK